MSNAVSLRGHIVDTVDPVEEKLELLGKPHFAYAKAPPALDALNSRLLVADAYVFVTPEYNHSPGPALLNLIDHHGSSVFGFKPSLIVSYSAGQWGGTRAAHALRPALSECGCIPVSAMVHVPEAHRALDEKGTPNDNVERWTSYANRGVSQLEWWATAAKQHKTLVDPFNDSPALKKSPEQRNAP